MFDTVAGLAEDMRRGRMSSRSLVDLCLDRIESRNPDLHAFVSVFADAARNAADAADAATRQGRSLGPLHGVPFATKDLADIAGHAPSFGSRVYGRDVAKTTAPAIRRLQDAGAILIGVTHLVEFANGSWGTNSVMGTPRNPADPLVHRVPGGSSSGSAVAVAAGLVPFAIGSDTGGSIRIPAGLCGVVGFKPSYGRIPLDGIAPLGPTFDTLGPLAGHVEDARLVADIMAGDGIGSTPPPASIRLAILTTEALQPFGSDVENAWTAVKRQLADHGADLVEIRLPRRLVEYQSLNGRIVAHEVNRHLGAIVEANPDAIDPSVRRRVMLGRDVSETEYARLLASRQAEIAAFREELAAVDALVLPTTPLTAVPLAEVDEDLIPMSRFTRLANYMDCCAISIPIPSEALPVGLQIMRARGEDAELIGLASVLQKRIGSGAFNRVDA